MLNQSTLMDYDMIRPVLPLKNIEMNSSYKCAPVVVKPVAAKTKSKMF